MCNPLRCRPALRGGIRQDEHFFEVVSTMAKDNLSVLPVLTRKETYLGTIDQSSVISKIASAEGYSAPGGVLELEMGTHDYSMAELSRIIESNDAKIIYSYIR